MSRLTTLGLSSMLMSIENKREKENYFTNKIEPNLSLKERHDIREQYFKHKSLDVHEMSPSELYSRGLLKRGEFGWEIDKKCK